MDGYKCSICNTIKDEKSKVYVVMDLKKEFVPTCSLECAEKQKDIFKIQAYARYAEVRDQVLKEEPWDEA